jgi:macrodomain Ter protein organizer (MatP/YcbG family)
MYSDNYEVVIKWFKNQIHSGKAEMIFLNDKSAIRSFEKLDKNLAVLDQDRADLDHFISIHLNKSGIIKLKTTIRIYKKRQAEKNITSTSKLLQCTLYGQMSDKLDEIVKRSGKTKIQIINQLIRNADITDFIELEEHTEKQLDILD